MTIPHRPFTSRASVLPTRALQSRNLNVTSSQIFSQLSEPGAITESPAVVCKQLQKREATTRSLFFAVTQRWIQLTLNLRTFNTCMLQLLTRSQGGANCRYSLVGKKGCQARCSVNQLSMVVNPSPKEEVTQTARFCAMLVQRLPNQDKACTPCPPSLLPLREDEPLQQAPGVGTGALC